VSGWGIHHIDIAQWGNGTELTGPVEIQGSARFPDDDALCDNPLSWDTRMKCANGIDLIFTGDGPGFTGVRQGPDDPAQFAHTLSQAQVAAIAAAIEARQ
jgi:hypothetical protein